MRADWLSNFMSYARKGEAPDHMYFWVGMATLAAALRKNVWIDQLEYKWYPNFYVILVAPSAVVSKTTTAETGFKLLKGIKGIHFGPTTASWQGLFEAFKEVQENVKGPEGVMTIVSALAVLSGELGTFINTQDTEKIDQLVDMWDGRAIVKRTVKDGLKEVENPCLNLLGCTTPAWISQNVDNYMIGGGFMSRCAFVFAEEKQQYIAYPRRQIKQDTYYELQKTLKTDLEHISHLNGEFTLTEDAYQWGEQWYLDFMRNGRKALNQELLGGYIGRKQAFIHKCAMILSVSQSDDLTITKELLQRAEKIITEMENHMPQIYNRVGLTKEANNANKILELIARTGKIEHSKAFTSLFQHYPNALVFNDAIKSLHTAGMLKLVKEDNKVYLTIPQQL